MVASLPMYWRAETAEAWRRFWQAIRAEARTDGVEFPDLTAPEELGADWAAHWCDPALVLSMACSLPFRTVLRDKVRYVATLDFGLGGPEGWYCSQVITTTRAQRTGPKRLAVNGFDSQSGWAAAHDPVVPGWSDVVVTGSHAASVAAVAEGRADVACIDAVTWRLVARHDPVAQHVRVIGQTAWTPGLPLITAVDRDPHPLRAALRRAVDTLAPADAEALGGLRGLVEIDPGAYLDLPLPPAPASS